MRTKPLLCIMAAAALLAGISVSAAAASTIYRAGMLPMLLQPNVLPVLVRVNDQGKVTHVAPAFELRPQYRRLLVKTLKQMVTGPARDGDGHAVASHVVMFMLAKSTPRSDGQYNFSFGFVKAERVPSFGLWFWSSNGHELALVQDIGRHASESCRITGAASNECYGASRDCGQNGERWCPIPQQADGPPDVQSAQTHTAKRATAAAATAQRARQPEGEHIYRLYKVAARSAEAAALNPRFRARVSAADSYAATSYAEDSQNVDPVTRTSGVDHPINSGVVTARMIRFHSARNASTGRSSGSRRAH